MLVHQPFLKCKNTHDCQTKIRLPYFIPEETFEHPARWPRADWKRTFLCPACMHVCDYTPQDLDWELDDKLDPSAHSHCTGSIEIACGRKRCKAQIRVFVVLECDRLNRQNLEELRSLWRFDKVVCESGHLVSTPEGSSFLVNCPDTDWL